MAAAGTRSWRMRRISHARRYYPARTEASDDLQVVVDQLQETVREQMKRSDSIWHRLVASVGLNVLQLGIMLASILTSFPGVDKHMDKIGSSIASNGLVQQFGWQPLAFIALAVAVFVAFALDLIEFEPIGDRDD